MEVEIRNSENINISQSEKEMVDLDDSWIHEYTKLSNMTQNYSKESMEFISMHFIYVNANDYIDKVSSEKYPLTQFREDGSERVSKIITKEQIIHLVQQKKRKTAHSKYQLTDILLYNINISPEHIQSFSQTDNVSDASFLQIFPIINDIEIPPSIFIFHSLNAFYFIFKEIDYAHPHNHTLKTGNGIKSILKSTSTSSSKSATKKVRISDSTDDALKTIIESNKKRRFTKKRLDTLPKTI